MYILGVNAGSAASHDPSACLVDERGRVLAFMEEERLSRVRHAPAQPPRRAVRACLRLAGITPADVSAVAVGWDEPRMSARQGVPWGFDSAADLLATLGLGAVRRSADLRFVPHHRAHAESAFHAGPYQEAAVLVADGNGEDESVSIFRARRDAPMVRVRAWPRVHSLGYLYEEACKWLGLSRLDAGKTMGLAAYGRGSDAPVPDWIVAGPDGDLTSAAGTDTTLDYAEIRGFWRERLRSFAGVDRTRTPVSALADDPLAVRVAWSVQAVVESVIATLAATARTITGIESLCIAGGVGLNCAANGRLPGPLYVPPVPHDAGVALGAAWSLVPPADREIFSAYTGGPPGDLPPADRYRTAQMPVDVDHVTDLLLRGRIGAVCRGRSEVGPRALCHRSILASPVADDMQDRVNQVKRREAWRPFGPVTNVDTDLWEPAGHLERYMVGAARLTPEGARALPAVAHVDGTTRPQRLRPGDEPFVDAVLTRLSRAGHPPVLVNTSFNGPGEPVVETAEQAVRCAQRLGLDFLVVNDDLVLLTGSDRAHAHVG